MVFLFYQDQERRIFMNDKAKAERNAYMKEWYKKNKDKAKVAQERYWEKKAKKLTNSKEI